MAQPIIGIDEVGRGPWAGPLVVGAVYLGEVEKPFWADLTDSKKLTAKKRTTLEPIILTEALATGLGWVPAQELDEIGLGPALKLAAERAIGELKTNLSANVLQNAKIIIDGTINLLNGTPYKDQVTLLPKADALVREVGAASIIAKVARDRYMEKLETVYPGYAFGKHVGYGTAAHKSALLDLGPCAEHRFSFRPVAEIAHRFGINTPVSGHPPETSGHLAEVAVADHLKSLGHTILAQNYKTPTYEIDLISTIDHKIYFTEVKYRQDSSHGDALEQITAKKRQQIHYAATTFLSARPELKNHTPVLAAASVSGPKFTVDEWFLLEE